MKTFLFYDIETSGLNPVFDQILTFAAIRTDEAFRELERHTFTVRLRPDVVPCPGAFLTHRLTMEDLSGGITEYDAALAVHRLVNEPETISLGYNTLGFDDEFLRFTFYRNLLDPYTHQYAGGCGRMDILPVVTLYRIFKPDILNWPTIEGRPSLKLELISSENKFKTSARAHDAMADVEATLALAKHLSLETATWDYCLGFFHKKTDEARVQEIPGSLIVGGESYRLGLMVSPSFGPDVMYMAPVLFLGHSSAYSNQGIWMRLDRDLSLLPGTGAADQLPVIRKRYGEARFVLPARDRFWGRLTSAQRESCEKNIATMGRNAAWFDAAVRFHLDFSYPVIPDLDPDAALYQDGFFSFREKREMAGFHDLSLDDKINKYKAMRSLRIKTLASRILFRNFPSCLDSLPDVNSDFNAYMARVRTSVPGMIIRGFRNDARYTCGDAARELDAIRQSGGLDEEQVVLLDALDDAINRL
ncbi:MAG: exonuclease domain-containing protein [Pseudomonadota bacterium]